MENIIDLAHKIENIAKEIKNIKPNDDGFYGIEKRREIYAKREEIQKLLEDIQKIIDIKNE